MTITQSKSILQYTLIVALLAYQAAATSITFRGNPLSPHVSSADPSVHVWDGTLYVYTSKDGNLLENGMTEEDPWTYAFMDGYNVFSTTDMENWIDHGEIFHSRDCPWGTSGWMWAPTAAHKDGTYYLYYPHKDTTGEWRVGVATATSPIGPFTDTGVPIDGAVGIDPMVFIDDNGEAYMYLNTAQVAKLKPNMVELAEPMRTVDYGASNFEEGTYMHKYNGKYYYSYSKWQATGATAYYSIGDSPYGPFVYQGPLSGTKHSAPDHHSIAEFKGKFYYFYHMDTPWQQKQELNWHGHRRIACFDELYYNDDGTIPMVNPNYFYINTGGLAHISSDDKYYNYDLWYTGGSTSTFVDISVDHTSDDVLYSSERYGDIEYNLPMSNGKYSVTLKFAENVFNQPGMRIFNVQMEGQLLIEELDVFAESGSMHAALDITKIVDITDNELNIFFKSIVDNAMVSAIAVEPVPVDPCNPSPCNDGFQCKDKGSGTYECIDLYPCDPDPCDLGLVCSAGTDGTYTCDTTPSPCDSQPCKSGFRCDDLGNGMHACIEMNPCGSDPCASGYICTNNDDGTYSCDAKPSPCEMNPCDAGFECNDIGDGNYECINTDPCYSNTCGNGLVCLANSDGTYECVAEPSPCDSSPCDDGFRCNDLGNGDYECIEIFSCDDGFYLRDDMCVPCETCPIHTEPVNGNVCVKDTSKDCRVVEKECPSDDNICEIKGDGTKKYLLYRLKDDGKCEADCIEGKDVAEKISKDGYSCDPCITECPAANICEADGDKLKYTLFRLKSDGKCETKCEDAKNIPKKFREGFQCDSCQ